MKLNEFQKILSAARRGWASVEPAERWGFAARVVAKWKARARHDDPLIMWERFARWGVAVTAVGCIVAVVWLQPPPEPSFLADLAGADADTSALF